MTKDRPNPESARFTGSSRESPSVEQRTAAWQQEFQSDRGAFRSAFEHAAIGIALVDLHGRYLTVNRSLCRIVGYGEEELLAINSFTIIHPDDQEASRSWGKRLLRGEIDHYHMQKRLLHKQGHVVWIELSTSIVRDDAGNPCYFVGQIQDISARKTAERESAKSLFQMERLANSASGIMHALESTSDDTAYSEMLRILLDSFESQAGIFLRFAQDGALVGRYLSPEEDRDARCVAPHQCDLWEAALLQDKAQIDNGPRPMGCGKQLTRSLIVPIRHDGTPLGLLHIGDAATDYDADDLDLLTRISSMIAPVVHARLERDRLTPREAEVMDLIVSGKTQKQIAAELAISIQTAAKHRAKVLDKMRVRNDVELVHRVMQMCRLST